MRYAARVDDNHKDIVQTLRNMGACVLDLARVGGGCPDILVGTPGGNWLLEIKNGQKPPSERKLTSDQRDFHDRWAGPLDTVASVEEAIEWLNHKRRYGL